MQTARLLFSIALILTGILGLAGCLIFRLLIKKEIEMMKREGKFDDEPDYMRTFRVTRSEFDLESNSESAAFSAALLCSGALIALLDYLI